MSEYNIGKDINELNTKVEKLTLLLQQVYAIIEFNIKNGIIKEPKE